MTAGSICNEELLSETVDMIMRVGNNEKPPVAAAEQQQEFDGAEDGIPF